MVKANILKMNESVVVERPVRQNYKKINLESLKEDDFCMKSYLSKLNVHDARVRFKIASKMLPTVKMNFPSDRKFMTDLWSCSGCTEPGNVQGCRDTQEHLLVCEGYKPLREGKQLDTDVGLVAYFKEILSSRL